MSDEKKVSTEIAIDADADTVWRALTEAEELKRWFPLDARVTPGEGGVVWLSWGEGADWEAPIEIWEPGRHLRTVDPAPSKLAVDYYIESRGGETVLRLVHSGFAADAWDDEIDTMTAGWRTFLATLRHYLDRHRGQPRTLAYFRHPVVELPRAEAYPRALTALGFPHDLAEGRPHANGDVLVAAPPVNLTVTMEQYGDAVLMIEIEPGRGKCRPAAWLSLYGDAGAKAPKLQDWLRGSLTRAFA